MPKKHRPQLNKRFPSRKARHQQRIDKLARKSIGMLIVVVVVLAILVYIGYYQQSLAHKDHEHANSTGH